MPNILPMARRVPKSIAEILALWASAAECAEDCGGDIKEHQIRDWTRRERVPSEHIHRLVTAAHKRGWKHVTADLISRLCAARKAA